MRGIKRPRNKYEIKLDNKHISFLIVGAVLIFAMMFVVGLYTGRRMSGGRRVDSQLIATLEDDVFKNSLKQKEDLKLPKQKELPFYSKLESDVEHHESTEDKYTKKYSESSDEEKPDEVIKQNKIYSIQIASFKDKQKAKIFADGLRGYGYSPYIEAASLPGRGIWYRVKVGRYSSASEAEEHRKKVESITGLKAIISVIDLDSTSSQ